MKVKYDFIGQRFLLTWKIKDLKQKLPRSHFKILLNKNIKNLRCMIIIKHSIKHTVLNKILLKR